MDTMDRLTARTYFVDYFCQEDVSNLCKFFDLDPVELGRNHKTSRIIGLILQLQRNNRFEQIAHLIGMLNALSESFNRPELAEIAHDLGVNLSAVPGGNSRKSEAMKLLSELQRTRRFGHLQCWLQHHRPDVVSLSPQL